LGALLGCWTALIAGLLGCLVAGLLEEPESGEPES
jgi:hypothetical protein